MAFLTGFFWTLTGVFDVPLNGGFDASLTGVLDLSFSGDLSFLLVCFTGNLWFSFTGFNETEYSHLPDLPLLMWDRFSGLVSILDVCYEVRHWFSKSLLARSSNLGNFLNLGGFANSSASCFLFKDAISDFIYFSIFIISLLHCMPSAYIFFGVGSLCCIWLSAASGKPFARSKESVAESSVIINKERIKYFLPGLFLFSAFSSLISCLMLAVR